MKQLTYSAAIHEATTLLMKKDPRVLLVGEGVADPTGIFGTTKGLQKVFGRDRVIDMPVSENGMTGICIGAAINGFRTIMTHQRIDFALLAMDQIVNSAAKWHYMFGGAVRVPLTIRMLIGRGWGQGSQHSQSLQATFAHIPGLTVVMPSNPADAQGMLVAAVRQDNPVIIIEHRWLYNTVGFVPSNPDKVSLKGARVLTRGKDATILATSFMVSESIRASEILKKEGYTVTVVDLRSISPLDETTILSAVRETGRFIVTDTGYASFGVASEVIARVVMAGVSLRALPSAVTLPDVPTPTSWIVAERYYPTYISIVEKILGLLGLKKHMIQNIVKKYQPDGNVRSDIPDPTFKGPF
jgi:acetoin:2,6-dichlorophenolindophenol oxidoreductase subunit beta